MMTPKYNVLPIERDGKHFYQVVGLNGLELDEPYGSVTQRLKIIGGGKTEALIRWSRNTALANVRAALMEYDGENLFIREDEIEAIIKRGAEEPQRVFEKAGDVGTRVHRAIDEFIVWCIGGRKGPPPYPSDEDVVPAYESFLKFVEAEDIDFLLADTSVASLRHKYGGRLDAVCYVRKSKKLVLADWKTSSGIRDDYAVQCAGYAMAFYETYGKRIDRAFVARFDKEKPGRIDFRYVNLPKAKKAWVHALGLNEHYGRSLWESALRKTLKH